MSSASDWALAYGSLLVTVGCGVGSLATLLLVSLLLTGGYAVSVTVRAVDLAGKARKVK